jgi:hypothetical protein
MRRARNRCRLYRAKVHLENRNSKTAPSIFAIFQPASRSMVTITTDFRRAQQHHQIKPSYASRLFFQTHLPRSQKTSFELHHETLKGKGRFECNDTTECREVVI